MLDVYFKKILKFNKSLLKNIYKIYMAKMGKSRSRSTSRKSKKVTQQKREKSRSRRSISKSKKTRTLRSKSKSKSKKTRSTQSKSKSKRTRSKRSFRRSKSTSKPKKMKREKRLKGGDSDSEDSDNDIWVYTSKLPDGTSWADINTIEERDKKEPELTVNDLGPYRRYRRKRIRSENTRPYANKRRK